MYSTSQLAAGSTHLTRMLVETIAYIIVVIHLLLIIGTNGQMMVSSNRIQTGKYPRIHLTVVAEVDVN